MRVCAHGMVIVHSLQVDIHHTVISVFILHTDWLKITCIIFAESVVMSSFQQTIKAESSLPTASASIHSEQFSD